MAATMTSDKADPATIARLSALPEPQFREIVNRDLQRDNPKAQERGECATPQESAALRSPALVDRWFTALQAASKSVEGQLAARQADYDATRARLRRQIMECEEKLSRGHLNDHDRQVIESRKNRLERERLEAKEKFSKSRSGTLRFKSGLDEWVVEARNLRDSVRDRLYDTVVTEERNRLAERVRVLEEAIRKHRDDFPDDDDPTDADEELWNLVG